MSQIGLKRVSFLLLIFIVGFFGYRCAATKEELYVPGEMAPMMMNHGRKPFMMTHSKDYVYPLTEINLKNVIEENQGLKMLQENATMVHDYYRGGVQEKTEGERLLGEEKWEEAMSHFIKSNRFLEVVVDYLPEDEPNRNIYGNHVVIFMPNLLIADNELKLSQIYRELKMDDDIYWAKKRGKKYLAQSLRSAKTEWALQVKRELEEE